MTRYQPALDIWTLDDTQRAALQPGQWVYAGERSNMGRFYGQGAATGKAGSVNTPRRCATMGAAFAIAASR